MESGLDGLTEITRRDLERSITRGVNNAAFELRRRVPDIVRGQVDRMSPRLRVLQVTRVEKASAGGRSATLVIGGRQGDILARHELGWTAPFVTAPIASKASDRYGNLAKRLRDRGSLDAQTIRDGRKRTTKRRAAKSGPGARVGRFFTISTRDRSRLAPGIYERIQRNNRIELVAAGRVRARFKPVFRIRDRLAEDAGQLIMRYVQESIDFRRSKRV